MAIQLVFKHVVGPYQVGDHVTDPALVAKYLASHPEYVIKKNLEESPSSSTPPASPASPSVPQLTPIN